MTKVFLAVFIIAVITLVIFYRSRKWKAAQGTINTISIKEIYRNPNTAFAENRSLYDYKVEIEYRYTVENKTHYGNTLIAGLPNIFSDKSIAQQYLNKYPEGQKVSVYCNPKNPNQSALETANSLGGIKTVLILALFFIVVAAFVGAGFYFMERF